MLLCLPFSPLRAFSSATRTFSLSLFVPSDASGRTSVLYTRRNSLSPSFAPIGSNDKRTRQCVFVCKYKSGCVLTVRDPFFGACAVVVLNTPCTYICGYTTQRRGRIYVARPRVYSRAQARTGVVRTLTRDGFPPTVTTMHFARLPHARVLTFPTRGDARMRVSFGV